MIESEGDTHEFADGNIEAPLLRSRSASDVPSRTADVDPSSLALLLGRPLIHSKAHVSVHVTAPELSASEVREWERGLDRLYNACGCEASTFVLLVSIPLLALLFLAAPGGISLFSPVGMSLALAMPIGGALVGKFAGLLWARMRLRRSIEELRSVVAARDGGRD
jgi:hypothetical protein